MAEELRFDVVSEAHSEGLTDAARDVKALKGETDKLGDSFDATSRDAFDLTEQIAHTREQVRQLAAEFSRTGDKGLLGNLRQQRSMLAELERVAKDLRAGEEVAEPLGRVDDAAGKAGASLRGMSFDAKALNAEIARSTARLKELDLQLLSLGDDKGLRRRISDERSWLAELRRISKDRGGGVGSGLGALLQEAGQLGTSIRGAATPALIGAAVAAAPFIGAAISGAVVGGVGLGGIAGGVFAASRDEGVRAEASHLGDVVGEKFFSSGAAVVEPLKRTLRELGYSFAQLPLEELFAKAAPAVEIVGRGIGDLARNLLPGLNAVMGRAVPISEAVADGLGEVGDGVSDALVAMAGSSGTIKGLSDTFTVLADTIRTTGSALTWLADLYYEVSTGHVLRNIGRELTGTDVPRYMHAVGQETQGATGAVVGLRTAVEGLNNAFSNVVTRGLSLDQAQLRVKETSLALTEAIRENGRHWEDNTRAGLANQQALLGQVQNLNRAREAEINAGGSVEAANVRFQQQLEVLYRQAQAAGASKKALDNLVGEYLIKIRTLHIDEYREELSAAGYTGGRGKGRPRQHGGPVFPDVEYAVNEHLHGGRPVETVSFGAAGMVHPARLTPAPAPDLALARPAPAQVTVRVESAGGELEDMMARMLARWVSVQGGDVQLAVGR